MVRNDTTISLELVERARQGSAENLSALAGLVRADLLAYLRRLTLDSHLAEDLYQETMLEMVRHLPQLEFTSLRAFWGWLYKIALSKACRQRRKRVHHGRSDMLDGLLDRSEHAPPHLLMRQELTQAVCEAVARLKVSQRNVVALRCFNELSYAEIATITGGTQTQAKLRFFRARQMLKRHLRRAGFRASHLLPALGLFAALTDKSVRAGTSWLAVKANMLEVGLGTAVVGSLVSKAGLAAAVAIAVAVLSTIRNSPADHIVASPITPLTHKMKIPGYIYPRSVVQTYDPDAGGWVSRVPTPQGDHLQSTSVEEILIRDHSLPGKSLLLPAGHWVQVRFPVPVTDGPDVDLFLTGYGLAPKPRVALIGPNGEQLDLEPSASQDQPSGFTIIAYDLSGIAPTFLPYDVRVTGTGGGDTTSFALRMIRVGLP